MIDGSRVVFVSQRRRFALPTKKIDNFECHGLHFVFTLSLGRGDWTDFVILIVPGLVRGLTRRRQEC